VSPTPAIAVRSLSHTYRSTQADRAVLRSVDLRVEPGQLVALTGASGSGKTTLLTICGALRSPQEGEVHVLGTSLFGLGEEQRRGLRGEIGFIFQGHHLIDALTAGQNVVMSLLGRVPPGDATRRAARALDLLGLADRIDDLPDQLSGGEKQRVAVARALVRTPRLVLADEPSASLDDTSTAAVVDAIRTFVDHGEAAALIATHDARVVARADRILHLHAGVLSEGAVPTSSNSPLFPSAGRLP